ncbi:MAG: hypothetical protein B6229_01900 [Spirochaetaceae bacterium 4572_7]|nr:MAG: hypothetical protein B6229_01900 [Spirochaetaceae bacterium 4572_7]
MKNIIKFSVLTTIYIMIIYLSLKHPSGQPSTIPYIDKIGHFIAYFTLSFTIFISFMDKKIRIILLLLSLTLGIGLEFIQGALVYRDMSVADGVANATGLLFGIPMATFIISLKKRIWSNYE